MMPAVHTRILPSGSIKEDQLTYVVIATREKEKWIFVRHQERSTWEMPAGHIEKGETADQAARRELFEETGTVRSTLSYLCDYQISVDGKTESGRLYFASILERNAKLEYEIEELNFVSDLPASLTYPEVQGLLFQHANKLLRS